MYRSYVRLQEKRRKNLIKFEKNYEIPKKKIGKRLKQFLGNFTLNLESVENLWNFKINFENV